MRLRTMPRTAAMVLAAVLMLAVWVLVTWVGSRPALKVVIDLTPQQVFTVSPATEELLGELHSRDLRVDIHTFFQPWTDPARVADEEARQWLSILHRVQDLTEDLLRRYAMLGGSNVRLHLHDLQSGIAQSREASLSFGLNADDIDTLVIAVEQSGRPRRHKKLSLRDDLAVIERPGAEAAPSPVPRANLPVLKGFRGEEAISSALKGLLVTGVPVACFVKGYSNGVRLDDPAIDDGYGMLQEALRQEGFETRPLELRAGIPDDAAAVVILEPTNEFTEPDAQALHAYLRRGGRVLINYVYTPLSGWNPTGGAFGNLIGYSVSEGPVLHLIPDPRNPQGRGLDGDVSVGRLDIGGMHNTHPVTRPLALAGRPLVMARGRELRLPAAAVDGVQVAQLLGTGPHAWLGNVDAEGRPNARAPWGTPGAFGTRLLGAEFRVESDKPDRPGLCVVLTALGGSNAGIRTPNRDLYLNLLNHFAERRELVTVRADHYEARTLRLTTPQVDRIKWLLMGIIPGGLLVLGVLVYRIRNRNA